MSSSDHEVKNDGVDSTDVITIYVVPGSQYSAKVLAALDSRNITHYCSFVNLDPAKRKLPSGGRMVPEMTISGEGKDLLIMPDSEDILHWFDENQETKFFPNALASELSVRASDGTLGGAVLYYNWVDPRGYARTMQMQLKKFIPPWILFFRDSIADYFASEARAKFRVKAMKQMGVEETDLNEEAKIRRLLLEELKFFQSHLKATSQTQQYFLPGEDQPSAADFSVYAQLQRLIGNMGDANIAPSFPELEDDNPQLSRLWEWHNLMKEKHPIKFKGKRLPPQKV